LAFPFDPLSDTACGYDKKRFMNHSVGFTKFFDPAEILLSGEFWDYISGVSKTMETMIDIINVIATPKFAEELAFLSEPKNRIDKKADYLDLLEKWFLFQEQELINKAAQIELKLKGKKLQSLYNQSCFKDGEYKTERVEKLLTL